ncbi:MAG: hypothetical protein EXQ47_00720 [Bryobacterales bacterium]|nr:hypothetical protein [Bryobacterales bacterium]
MVAPTEADRIVLNQEQVRRILQSKAFRTSEVHRNLFHYLSEKSLSGEAESLKEYTVGLDVFAKPESYDPRQESVVRMHMARLRQKLAEYYRTEGADDSIVVDLPKGAFKVTFELRPAVAESDPESVHGRNAAAPNSSRATLILAGLLAVAVACAAYFGIRLIQVERTSAALPAPAAWTPELRELWAPLLSADRPLVVVLATQPAGNLTGVSTANGAFLLGQFLADRKQSVYVTGSGDLSMPDIVMGNLVFLGAPSSNPQIQALPARDELVLESGGVRNLHPTTGEPEYFPNLPPRPAHSTVDESYALITNAPGVKGKGAALYLSGTNTSGPAAGVEVFTESGPARAVVEKIRRRDGKLPRYYQVLLKVKAVDQMPIDITYVFHKELRAQ